MSKVMLTSVARGDGVATLTLKMECPDPPGEPGTDAFEKARREARDAFDASFKELRQQLAKGPVELELGPPAAPAPAAAEDDQVEDEPAPPAQTADSGEKKEDDDVGAEK